VRAAAFWLARTRLNRLQSLTLAPVRKAPALPPGRGRHPGLAAGLRWAFAGDRQQGEGLMGKVTVHHCLVWDHERGCSVIPPMKSTIERIALIGGKILPGTAEEVEASDLDGRCRYVPRLAADNDRSAL
jgi:hypothetical protein